MSSKAFHIFYRCFLVMIFLAAVFWLLWIAPQAIAQTSAPPVKSTVDQAERQAEGEFGELRRSEVGGQIQEAWDKVKPEAGNVSFKLCELCTYKIRTRQHMVTVIELPENEVATKADIGDGAEFEVQQRTPNRLSIKPAGYGVDTNLFIHGRSGRLYSFYVRAEKFNSKNLPDLFVKIRGKVAKSSAIDLPFSGETVTHNFANDLATQATGGGRVSKDDFVETREFDPSKVHGWGQYRIWGEGNHLNKIKPVTVFRDDQFTYLKFGLNV